MSSDNRERFSLLIRSVVFVAMLVVVSAALIAVLAAFNARRKLFSQPRGLVNDTTKLPKYLRTTLDSLRREDLIPNHLDVFRCFDSENDRFGVRFAKIDSQCDRIVTAMSLTRVDANQPGASNFNSYMPTEWGFRGLDDVEVGSEFFVSAAWLNGDEGPMYVLRADPSDEYLYIYYYYNF